MPIYEYRCQSCGHELEKLQRMNDASLTDCPECGKSALKRLISAAGFRLKGTGWYETDFKTSNQRNLADSGSDSKPDSKSDSGAEKAASKASGKESAKESKRADSTKPTAVDKSAKANSSAPPASS